MCALHYVSVSDSELTKDKSKVCKNYQKPLNFIKKGNV